jgi:hypothetical protein
MRKLTRTLGIQVMVVFAIRPAGYAQSRAPDCFRGDVHVEPRRIEDFLIRFQSVKDKKNSQYAACQVQVFSSRGPVFQAVDATMTIDDVSGKDINGDGKPEAVFVGYSGGAHCCWTYWIVSLGDRPGLIKEVANQTAVGFRDTADGHLDLRTGDGVFDYFDCLSHAETVFPTVFLRLRGQELQDVGPEHWDDYADQIAKARRSLSAEELHQFREVKNQDELCEGNRRATIPKVLTIVFAYLCGGREQEAWKALDEMWPRSDQERIRKLILQKRAEGILRHTKPVARRKKG